MCTPKELRKQDMDDLTNEEVMEKLREEQDEAKELLEKKMELVRKI